MRTCRGRTTCLAKKNGNEENHDPDGKGGDKRGDETGEISGDKDADEQTGDNGGESAESELVGDEPKGGDDSNDSDKDNPEALVIAMPEVSGMAFVPPAADSDDGGFYVGIHEVTQELYESVMGVNPSQTKDPHGPVTNVRWNQAMEFCQRLNLMDEPPAGLGELPEGFIYTLPTEAQWEYACTEGGKRTKPYSDLELDLVAYCQSNLRNSGRFYDGPTQVGSKRKSTGFGLFDMLGNVAEWCRLENDDPQSLADREDEKVLRGGSYFDKAAGCQPTSRQMKRQDTMANRFGFRIAAVKTSE